MIDEAPMNQLLRGFARPARFAIQCVDVGRTTGRRLRRRPESWRSWLLALCVLVGAPTSSAQTSTTVEAAEAAKPASPWDAPEPWRTDRFYVMTSLYTWHFHYDSDHKQAAVLNVEYRFKERWLEGQWFGGGSLFTNSFGQFSQYVYGGLLWRPIEKHQPFFLKLSAGVVHGYSGEYQDKIPFNSSGFAPAIIPSAGYCINRYCGELILLGANAMLFGVGVTLP